MVGMIHKKNVKGGELRPQIQRLPLKSKEYSERKEGGKKGVREVIVEVMRKLERTLVN